jgi:hypothetical protein
MDDSRAAVQQLIDAIRGVFKNCSRGVRRKSWDSLQSSDGKAVVNKLINDPKAVVSGTARLLHFKEWLSDNS